MKDADNLKVKWTIKFVIFAKEKPIIYAETAK